MNEFKEFLGTGVVSKTMLQEALSSEFLVQLFFKFANGFVKHVLKATDQKYGVSFFVISIF